MSGSMEVAQGLSITYNRLYIFVFALLVFAVLLAIMQKTRLGLEAGRDTEPCHGTSDGNQKFSRR